MVLVGLVIRLAVMEFFYPGQLNPDIWLATLLFAILFLVTLYMEESTSLTRWLTYGLFWGFVALTDPVVLAGWPFMLGRMAYRMHRQKLRWVFPAAVSVLGLVMFVAPWFVRNYVVFGTSFPSATPWG